jgi:hypothetical protein
VLKGRKRRPAPLSVLAGTPEKQSINKHNKMNQPTNQHLKIKSPLFLSKKMISYVQTVEVKPGRLPKVLKKLIWLSIFINILTIVLFFIFRNRIPPEVPLYYGLADGDNQLSQANGLLIPSLFALCVILLNTILAAITKNEFIKYALILTAFGVSILVTVTFVRIMLLVGSF